MCSHFPFFPSFFLPHANRCNMEYTRDGEAIGRSRLKEIRVKEWGENGRWNNMIEGKKGMDRTGEEREKRWGEKVAEGGHCWCWNQRLEVKSWENKCNLHHWSTELSSAFHLPPPPHPANSPHHSTAFIWKTGFKGCGKKEIYNHYLLLSHPHSDPCLFSLSL